MVVESGMGWIKCLGCKGKVSDSAQACPHCGMPFTRADSPSPSPARQQNRQALLQRRDELRVREQMTEWDRVNDFFVNDRISMYPCRKCNRRRALRTTGAKRGESHGWFMGLFKPFDPHLGKEGVVGELEYEVKCKYCGDRHWIEKPRGGDGD